MNTTPSADERVRTAIDTSIREGRVYYLHYSPELADALARECLGAQHTSDMHEYWGAEPDGSRAWRVHLGSTRALANQVAGHLLSSTLDGLGVALIALHYAEPEVRVSTTLATRRDSPVLPATLQLGAADAVLRAPDSPPAPDSPLALLAPDLLEYLGCYAVAIVSIASTPDYPRTLTLLIDPSSNLTSDRVRLAAAYALLSPPEALG